MSIRLISGGDLKSVLDGRAMVGQALLGCLLMSSFQVSLLLCAMGPLVGAKGHTHYFGILLISYPLRQGCNMETHWVLLCFHPSQSTICH